MKIFYHSKQALIVTLWMPVFLCSCASYNKRVADYYNNINNGQYSKAMYMLEKNKLLQKERNKLLYLFEKGNLYHLMHLYDSSNYYFNAADNFIEIKQKTLGDISKGYLLNPMLQTYLGESFERLMIHYYKCLNYCALNNIEDAIVEAKRITLANNKLSDVLPNNKKYNKDAFATNLQGILYEMNGDINNAFIAYRNAADIYLANNNQYYGVVLPNQLKQDVLRTASIMGFDNELHRYEKLLHTTLQEKESNNGAVVVFIERGAAPIKREKNYTLTKNNNGINGFYFYDDIGNQINVPFNYNQYSFNNYNKTTLESFRVFRVALPVYEITYFNKSPISIEFQAKKYTTELAQDINTLATSVLNERMLTEITNAIARQLTKRLTEYAAKKTTESVSKNNSKETDEKKKQQKATQDGEVAGLIMNLINTATEKADTRNWQSLPAFIDYIKIPLQKGENKIIINGKTINVTANGGLQMRSVKF